LIRNGSVHRVQIGAPVAHEVAADNGQQKKRHETEGKRADLQTRRELPRRKLARPKRQVTPRCGKRFSNASSPTPTPRRRAAIPRRRDHDEPGLRLARLESDQQRDRRGAEHIRQKTASERPRQIAAQHP